MKISQILFLFICGLNYPGYSQTINLMDSINYYSLHHPQDGLYEETLTKLQSLKQYASTKDSYYPYYLTLLAETYMFCGKFTRAISEYEQIRKLPNNDTYSLHAAGQINHIYMLTGQFKKAIQSTYYLLGNDLEIKNFEQADQTMGTKPGYENDLVYLYKMTGQNEKALRKIQYATTPEEINYFSYIKSQIFYEKKQLDSALYYCTIYSSNEVNHNDFSFLHFAYKIHLEMGDSASGKEYYLKTLVAINDYRESNKISRERLPKKYFSCWFYKSKEDEIATILKDKLKWVLN